VPVPRQESERSYIFVSKGYIVCLVLTFLVDFGTVLILWYLFVFHLIKGGYIYVALNFKKSSYLEMMFANLYIQSVSDNLWIFFI
jgi:hypothetical protein